MRRRRPAAAAVATVERHSTSHFASLHAATGSRPRGRLEGALTRRVRRKPPR